LPSNFAILCSFRSPHLIERTAPVGGMTKQMS
jgi:hypothetical protein